MGTNKTKTKYMVLRGPTPPKPICKEAYNRRMTGRGETYIKRRKEEAQCQICNKVMTKGSLHWHMREQHNKKPKQYLYKDKGTSATFNVDIKMRASNRCPVPGCTGASRDKFGMYRHFCRKHPEAKIII